jgi:hypothetical protein
VTWLQVLLVCGVILFTGYILTAAISGVIGTLRSAAGGIENKLDEVKFQLEMLDNTLCHPSQDDGEY